VYDPGVKLISTVFFSKGIEMKTAQENQAVLDKIKGARARLIMAHPFFGFPSLALKIEVSTQVQTASVNGIRIRFNADYVNSMNDKELQRLVAHEVSHCMLLHPYRRFGRDHEMWNEACDYAANHLLKSAGFEFGRFGLYDPAYHDMSAEQIYSILQHAQDQQDQDDQDQQDQDDQDQDQDDQDQDQDDQDQDQDDQDGDQDQDQDDQDGDQDGEGDDQDDQDGDQDGEGQDGDQDGEGQDGEGKGGDQDGEGEGEGSDQDGGGEGKMRVGDVEDYPGADRDADSEGDDGTDSDAPETRTEQDWEALTTQSAQVAQAAGKAPGSLDLIGRVHAQRRVDWKSELRKFVSQLVPTDYSFLRPNRRHVGRGMYIPGIRKELKARICLTVDTSGSVVWSQALPVFMAELDAIMEEGIVEVILLFCDTEVYHVGNFTEGPLDIPQVSGGGGTSFLPPFDWIEENQEEIDGMIYFTDGWGDFPTRPEVYPVLWMLSEDHNKPNHGDYLVMEVS